VKISLFKAKDPEQNIAGKCKRTYSLASEIQLPNFDEK
jgi:hypothetical protein